MKTKDQLRVLGCSEFFKVKLRTNDLRNTVATVCGCCFCSVPTEKVSNSQRSAAAISYRVTCEVKSA